MYKNEELLKKRKVSKDVLDLSEMFIPKHNSFEKKEDVSIVWEILTVVVFIGFLVAVYLYATS